MAKGRRNTSKTESDRRPAQISLREAQEQAANSNPGGVPPASAALSSQPDGLPTEDQDDVVTVSNPAGESKEIRKTRSDESGNIKKLSKYEVGWRRVVRNFSPS